MNNKDTFAICVKIPTESRYLFTKPLDYKKSRWAKHFICMCMAQNGIVFLRKYLIEDKNE